MPKDERKTGVQPLPSFLRNILLPDNSCCTSHRSIVPYFLPVPMKKIVLLYLLLLCAHAAMADHITGGEIYYSYTGVSGGQYQYNITLKLFMVCNTIRQFNDPTYVSFFDKASNA